MADDPLKTRDLGLKKRTPNGVTDDPKHNAPAAEGIPQPGDVIDRPTQMADGREQSPTRKNYPTDLATGERQGKLTDTSTGKPTAKADEPPTGQSSGAKKMSSMVSTKKEVEQEMQDYDERHKPK